MEGEDGMQLREASEEERRAWPHTQAAPYQQPVRLGLFRAGKK